jgi:polyhydroxyalkanoate synthesis repressor PhaR
MNSAVRQTVVIRKYENRRLYDTAASRYVNLDEVAEMIRQGTEVQVLDARTGEDLTRVILTQIVVEDAKGRQSALPLDFLRQLVVASGRAGQEGFGRYLKSVFETYQRAFDTFEQRLRETPTPLDWMGTALHPQPAPNAAEPPDKAANEVAELRRRVEELERRLATPPPKRSRPRRGSPSRK